MLSLFLASNQIRAITPGANVQVSLDANSRISISTAANPTAIGDDASGGVRILQPDNQIRSIKNGSLINCQVQSGSIIIGVNDGATTKINNSVSGAQLTGQAGLSGGGLITWSGTKTVSGTTYLKWGARVNVMPVQRDELALGGFYEATCPGNGVQIAYYPSSGGTTTTTCTSDIPLKAFEAQQYVTGFCISTFVQLRIAHHQRSLPPALGVIVHCGTVGDRQWRGLQLLRGSVCELCVKSNLLTHS
jgi:methyl coenzyme M reductase subunit D